MATAVAVNGPVTVTYADTITNGCGGTKIVSRLWTATDVCGNSTNALQTITVQDTTPPSISAPADVVLECPANTATNATGIATASDTCGSVTLSYSDQVSQGTNGTERIVRTWTATDACGNRASAVQTLTVRDTTPPTISYAVAKTISKDGFANSASASMPGESSFTTVFPGGLVIGLTAADSLLAGHAGLRWESECGGMVGA